eukprot:1321073-Amorphochlora_amoeboformis.AAC.1
MQTCKLERPVRLSGNTAGIKELENPWNRRLFHSIAFFLGSRDPRQPASIAPGIHLDAGSTLPGFQTPQTCIPYRESRLSTN